MTDIQIFDLTPENIADYGICGYKDTKKHLELRRKIEPVFAVTSQAQKSMLEYCLADNSPYTNACVGSDDGFELTAHPAIQDWLARIQSTPGYVPTES